MTCPPTGNEEGLVKYWNFEEYEGETHIDLTGNGNDGTNGATYKRQMFLNVSLSINTAQ